MNAICRETISKFPRTGQICISNWRYHGISILLLRLRFRSKLSTTRYPNLFVMDDWNRLATPSPSLGYHSCLDR